MPTSDYFYQQDFSGGENSLVQAEFIAENEVASMINMLPRRSAIGMEVRNGFDKLDNIGGTDPIISLFTKRVSSGNTYIVWVEYDSSAGTSYYAVDVDDIDTESPTIITIKTIATGINAPVYFTDWDANKILFSDGETGMYMFDFDTPATPAVMVQDKSPAVNVNLDGDYKYLTQHKFRLFMATPSGNGALCTVMVSGSSDGGTDSPSGTIFRYEDWSGLGIQNGGSVDIVPYGEDIVGLATSFNGLIIFKENSIHQWSFPDGAAPWDAAGGAQIDLISSEIGCISHNTIVNFHDKIYFMGRNRFSDIGLYVLDSSGSISELSTKVPRKAQSILTASTESVSAELYDGYYIVSAKGAETGLQSLLAVYDTKSNSWSTLSGLFNVSSHSSTNYGYILLGDSSGAIWQYPSPYYSDGVLGDSSNRTPIRMTILTRRFIGRDQGEDLYFRLLRVSGGIYGNTTLDAKLIGEDGAEYTIDPISLTIFSNDYWPVVESGYTESIWPDESDNDPNDGTTWTPFYELTEDTSEVGFRTRGAQLELTTELNNNFHIDYIGVATRPRRSRNYRYA